jgi:hypothetical protein
MRRRFRPVLTMLVLAAGLTTACGDAALDDAEELEFRDSAGQGGPVFNTPKIFTSEVAQVDTQGVTLAGVTLGAVQVVYGGELVAIDAGSLAVDHGTVVAEVDGVELKGTEFIGSVWSFHVSEGGSVVTVQAFLTEVETSFDVGLYDPDDPEELRRLDPARSVYRFKWDDGDGLVDTCEEDEIGGALAVIYGDILVDHTLGTIVARPNTLYFGCISGAVGKASLWGYAPDSPSLPSLSLPAFTTATRLVRADYCADGVAHTDVGNPVELFDRWGINDSFNLPAFTTEAVWDVGGGARCMKQIRNGGNVGLAGFVCADNTVIPRCVGDTSLKLRWNQQSAGDFWSRTP